MLKRKRAKAIPLLLALSALIASDAYAISWGRDLTAALDKAKKTGKPVMIDFYTDRCGWCRKLDEDTYTDARVSALAAKFICVKIDGNREKALIRKYSVGGYPHTLFLNVEGATMGRITGYAKPEGFIMIMEKVLKDADVSAKAPDKKTAKPQPQPRPEANKAPAGLSLTGIIYDPVNPQAIINDEIVGVGGRVGDAEVVKIEERKVFLRKNDTEFELTLNIR